MKARLVVFPIRGRNWCFSRCIDPSATQSPSGDTPTTIRELWKKVSSESKPVNENAELLVDFISNKMTKAWVGLEKAPRGTMKNKIYGLGQQLLGRVKPSEIFLKSITKEVTGVQITYPSSLDPRLVRRRLRHIALRGTIIHKKYLYGSATLLPLTTAFAVLPLPNIPFFWALFRTYSHWRALKGSERLLQLVSNHSESQKSVYSRADRNKNENNSLKQESLASRWVLQPSEELQQLLLEAEKGGLSESTISNVCKSFDLSKIDVLKYMDQL